MKKVIGAAGCAAGGFWAYAAVDISDTAESTAQVRAIVDIEFSGGWSIIYLALRLTSQVEHPRHRPRNPAAIRFGL
jgi:hypothetical protein